MEDCTVQKAGLINLKDGSTENTQTDAQREKKKSRKIREENKKHMGHKQ